MKIFKVYENEDYKPWIVAAEDMHKAIELFKKATNTAPVKIIELTADNQQVIIQGLIEPDNDLPF